ncbi:MULTISPECIES: pyridoxal-phosphate dependent enzyme [unclassified Streptomyces]|uniref:pyridoxal-phosphate dependent enzyme n=1 Tax=unclassified Streptomyces TaxID=2593676 RepID=UPI00278BFF95|nr:MULTISPECIES: pyridoxal-phosphate dependent enzyme [unclassified Streptomyces]
MDEHIAEAVKEPHLIGLEGDLSCLRFETMKLYSALGAVRHLLDRGTVRPGDTLIDSSSGIYAHALALACHRYGLRCHIVGSTTVDRTLRVQLEVLGATLEQVRPSRSLRLDQELRVRRIGEILDANPSYHWMRQYHDEIHYYGYRAVAARLDRELPGGAVTLTGGVGSGASTGALATYLREAGRQVRLVGVQPFGSVTFGSEHVSDPDMIIAGIGSAIEFRNVRHALYDRVHWIDFDSALSGAVGLLRGSGIFAGLSAGAAYLAARWERSRERGGAGEAGGHHVFIAADTGHRYVEHAYARHRDARPLSELAPREIGSLGELSLPWSAMSWPGVPVPADPVDARTAAA